MHQSQLPTRQLSRPVQVALLCAVALAVVAQTSSAQVIFTATGLNAAGIQGTVDNFRAALGPLNANVAGSFATGRREINWDGVPDAFAAPNNLPAGFFNANSPRGVVFSTPGTGFQVSANAASGTPVNFGNIDPNYPQFFAPFSAQRMFTPIGSNITDVSFFVPGGATAATTNAFGVVFSDVDVTGSTSLEFFDTSNFSLGVFLAAPSTGNLTFSFLGVQFGSRNVGRVRITSGNKVLAAGNTSEDLVVMDDFIYGEPIASAVPEPATWALLAFGLTGIGISRRRKSTAANR